MARRPALEDGHGDMPTGKGGATKGVDEPALFDERLLCKLSAKANPRSKQAKPSSVPAETEADYHGHRERLRNRYRENGEAALADYEILELLLFRLIPRRDT